MADIKFKFESWMLILQSQPPVNILSVDVIKIASNAPVWSLTTFPQLDPFHIYKCPS